MIPPRAMSMQNASLASGAGVEGETQHADLTHGEVIAALVANRLTAPRPLYDVVGWAQSHASNDWLGVPAGLLNDDRLGRALDALSRHLDEVAGALAMAAIARFGADAARLHWDFTSVAFCGSHADPDPPAPPTRVRP